GRHSSRQRCPAARASYCSVPYAVKPVTVYDYVAPEARDIARRYTVRQMIMGMPTLASGTFHDTELLSAGGFTVRFMDYNITRHF
ncbi:MAG: hypothetical protein AAGI44_16450, partial [Pseudomonadota bacterium]